MIAEPDQGQREREHQAVAEHAPGQVAEVAGDPHPAEHREHAPPQHRADQDHHQVDAAVGRLAELAAGVDQRQPAPEGEHAEQVEPERVVAREARAQVDPEREQHRGEAEVERDELADLEVVQAGAEQERHQVHAHVPQRDRDRHQHEREAVAPQQHRAGGERAELHHQPAAVDEHVEVAVGLGCVPVAERGLGREDRQRHHHHRQRGHDAGRDRQLLALEQPVGEREKQDEVAQRGGEPAPAAERVPAERHEQRHGADRDHAAEVVQHVHQGEARPFVLLDEELEQALGLAGVDDPCLYRLL